MRLTFDAADTEVLVVDGGKGGADLRQARSLEEIAVELFLTTEGEARAWRSRLSKTRPAGIDQIFRTLLGFFLSSFSVV